MAVSCTAEMGISGGRREGNLEVGQIKSVAVSQEGAASQCPPDKGSFMTSTEVERQDLHHLLEATVQFLVFGVNSILVELRTVEPHH